MNGKRTRRGERGQRKGSGWGIDEQRERFSSTILPGQN